MVLMLASIDLSQEIPALDMLIALNPLSNLIANMFCDC